MKVVYHMLLFFGVEPRPQCSFKVGCLMAVEVEYVNKLNLKLNSRMGIVP